jgi:hypothetical protein
MVKIAIKVDFLNSKVEFSPNTRVEKKSSSDQDKPVFIIEISPTSQENQYPSFTLSNNEVSMDEPMDEEDKFWKGSVELDESPPSPSPPPMYAPPPIEPEIQEAPEPAYQPPARKSTPSPVSKGPEAAKLLGQFEALKRMISQLDAQFEAGNIAQDQYLQKKNFLGEQMGKLMGDMDAKGIHYEY